MYGIGIWGSIINESSRKMLYTLQKRLLRARAKVGFRAHTLPIHRKYGILTVFDQIEFEQLKLMHRYVNNRLPTLLETCLETDLSITRTELTNHPYLNITLTKWVRVSYVNRSCYGRIVPLMLRRLNPHWDLRRN